MPHSKHLKIIIGVDGSCSVDAHNFTDASCKTATQEIIAALGGGISFAHDKPKARVRSQCGERQPEQTR